MLLNLGCCCFTSVTFCGQVKVEILDLGQNVSGTVYDSGQKFFTFSPTKILHANFPHHDYTTPAYIN